MVIEDMKELDIERKDLEQKSGNYKLLEEHETKSRKIEINKRCESKAVRKK